MARLDAKLVATLVDGAALDTLHALNAAKQGLAQLPALAVPGLLSQLTRLDLSQNNITSVASLQACPQLTWLSLAHNKLASLDGLEKLTHLAVLNCSHNAIDSLAPVMALSNLKALVANNNSIEEVGRLDRLPQLNTLVLSHNRIQELGKGLAKLHQLAKLSASHNQLASLGRSLRGCTALAELRIAHNALTELPGELEQNGRLHILDAGNNSIRNWTQLEVVGKLRQLNNLNLRGNPLCEKPGYQEKVLSLCLRLRVLDGRRLEKQANAKQGLPSAQDKGTAHAGKLSGDLKGSKFGHDRAGLAKVESKGDKKGSRASRDKPSDAARQLETEQAAEDGPAAQLDAEPDTVAKDKGEKRKGQETPAKERKKSKKAEASTGEGGDRTSFLDLIAPQTLAAGAEEVELPKGGTKRGKLSKKEALLAKESGVVAVLAPRKAKDKGKKRIPFTSPLQSSDLGLGLGGISAWGD